jgi:RHS repeat-associated protein
MKSLLNNRVLLRSCFFCVLSVIATAQSGSDDCGTPDPIAGFGTFGFDTLGATTGTEGQNNSSCSFFGSTEISDDVWFAWTAPQDGPVRISTCDAFGDTKIAVYDGAACPTIEPIICNDDACGLSGFMSEGVFAATAGSVYMLQIGNFSGAGGSSGLMEFAPADGGGGGDPPANDDCDEATEISESFGILDGTTTDASTDGPNSTCGGIQNDVWYSFEIPHAGDFSLGVFPMSMQEMQVFLTDELGASPPAGCPLDVPGQCGMDPSFSTFTFPVQAGDVYVLRVGNSPGGTPGEFSMIYEIETCELEITGQPVGAEVCSGDGHTFTVVANGDPFTTSYQWFKDGVSLPGETNPSLIIDPATTADAGSYHVVVSNECGDLPSTPATLGVTEAPEITSQPVGGETCSGGVYTFTVEVSDDGTVIAYQWYKDGVPLLAAVSTALHIDPADVFDRGAYHVVVSNECGEVTSSTATLDVSEGPEITGSPVGGDFCTGDEHTMFVGAVGTGDLSFQWFKDGAVIPGAIDFILDLSDLSLADSGSYSVEVTDDCGTTSSGEAVVSVSFCGDLYEPEYKSHTFAEPGECPECIDSEGFLDPVYLFSGEYYLEQVDLSIPGRGTNFVWARKYRSRTGPDTAQGVGWDFSYDLNISQSGGDLVLDDGNSRSDTYELQADGSWGHEGFFRKITEEPDGSYRVRFANHGAWEFHPFDGSSQEGKVTAIEDRNSNRMEFEYDAQGKLVLIRDTLSREIAVAYHSTGRVASVTDFIGRQVTYEYYQDGDAGGGEGDLASVTTPSVVGTPNGNDFPAGKTTVYTYSTGFDDEALNHNLLTITDPKGQTWLVNEYDTSDPSSFSYDHIVRQTWGDPGDVIDVVYAEVSAFVGSGQAVRKAIVNDRVGNVKELFFDADNNMVMRRDYTGRADPDQPTTDPTDPGGNPPVNPLRPGDPAFFETLTEYNDASMPTRIVYPEENEELLVYDEANTNPRSRGNLLSRTLLPGPRGSADQPGGRTETFEYDNGSGGGGCCGSNFVTRHVDFRGNDTLHTYDTTGNRTQTQHRISSIVEDFEFNSFGQKTRHTLPNNSGHRKVDEFVYHGPGPQEGYLALLISDATGFALTTSFEYDAVGNTVRVVDPNGNDMLSTFNELDQIVRTQSAAVATALTGGSVRYETLTSYDANDNVVLVSVANIDETGVAYPNAFLDTKYTYETLDLVVSVERELDEGQMVTEELEYDSNRNQTVHKKGEATNGNQPANLIKAEYDERDLLFRSARAGGTGDSSTDQIDYDGSGNTTVVRTGIESDPRLMREFYDGFDRKVKVIDPMGNILTTHYDANGNPTSSRVDGELEDGIGSTGNVRLAEAFNEFDAMDRRTRARIQHFDLATQTPIGDGESISERVFSDASLVLSVTNDNGHVTTSTYDTALRLSRTTDAAGNTKDFSYDFNSNVVSEIETARSDLGEPDEVFTSTHAFDALNRPVSTKNNVDSIFKVFYDSRNNRVLVVDGLLREVRHVYDGLNRLLKTRRDLGEGVELVTSQAFDDSSRLVSQTDDNGNTTNYLHDALDRQIQETFSDGTFRTETFDVHDNAVTGTNANGTTFNATFDLLERFSSRTFVPGPGVLVDTTFEQGAYNGLSRVTRAVDDNSTVTFTYDSLRNVRSETLNGLTVTSSHDGVGNRTSLSYHGGRSLVFTHDDLERKKEILDASLPGAPSLIGSYDYIGPHRVSRRTLGNGTVMDITYDGITGTSNPAGDFGERKIIGVHHHIPGGATLYERSTTWDRVGNKTSGVTRVPDLPIAGERFSYDAADRMVRSEYGRSFDGPVAPGNLQAERRQDRDYVLDGVGNRVSVESSPVGALAGDGGYVTNSMNEYLTTPFDNRTYDANGNLTTIDPGAASERTILYDVRDRMIQHTDLASGKVTKYAYDALGRRIAKILDATGSPTITLYFYDGRQVVEERDGPSQLQATYVYGNYIDEPLTMARNGTDYWYHPDDLYNIRAVSDSNGIVLERYQYDDFGEAAITTGAGTQISVSALSNPYLFTARRYDPETDWYYFRTRYLDSESGNFTTRDTIGIWGDDSSFGNGTTYGGNNPWTSTDPSGQKILYRHDYTEKLRKTVKSVRYEIFYNPEDCKCYEFRLREQWDEVTYDHWLVTIDTGGTSWGDGLDSGGNAVMGVGGGIAAVGGTIMLWGLATGPAVPISEAAGGTTTAVGTAVAAVGGGMKGVGALINWGFGSASSETRTHKNDRIEWENYKVTGASYSKVVPCPNDACSKLNIYNEKKQEVIQRFPKWAKKGVMQKGD